MKIAITGASGFLGKHLSKFLGKLGHEIIPISRKRARNFVFWDPDNGMMDAASLASVDAVLHLAGESVSERWTTSKKHRIMQSRVATSELLVKTLSGLERLPRTVLSASAIGYYGSRDDQVLTEDSVAGGSYLSTVCMAWERGLQPLSAAGVRVANLRFGIVLSTTGGAFPEMVAPFKRGIGGKLGSGQQWMSWIDIEDTMRAINCILTDAGLSGPVNIVAPNPVRNVEFTDKLAHVLHKPAHMSVPTAMVHLTFGKEMSDEVLLCSTRAMPKKLIDAGFEFSYPNVEDCLRHIVDNGV